MKNYIIFGLIDLLFFGTYLFFNDVVLGVVLVIAMVFTFGIMFDVIEKENKSKKALKSENDKLIKDLETINTAYMNMKDDIEGLKTIVSFKRQ